MACKKHVCNIAIVMWAKLIIMKIINNEKNKKNNGENDNININNNNV